MQSTFESELSSPSSLYTVARTTPACSPDTAVWERVEGTPAWRPRTRHPSWSISTTAQPARARDHVNLGHRQLPSENRRAP
eukprot:6068602-Pyramimonas_sp.AAC.1